MDEESLRSGDSLPAQRMLDSAPLGWHTVLCRGYREQPRVDDLITVPTSDLGIVAVTAGTYAIESRRGKTWRSAVFRPGSVALNLPHEASHLRWRAIGDAPMESIQVHLSAGLLDEVATDFGVRSAAVLGPSVDLRDPFVFETCCALASAAAAGLPNSYAEVLGRALAVHLLVGPAPGQHEAARSLHTLRATALADVVEYMRANISTPISLQELASTVYLSKWHFLRQFKSTTGLPPHAYLTNLRISYAKDLISQGRRPGEVAAACGFGSASQFARTFRQRTGLSPTEFRRAFGQEEQAGAGEIAWSPAAPSRRSARPPGRTPRRPGEP